MHTSLRDLLDGRAISAAVPKAKKMSPMAQHITDHVRDPLGSTEPGFANLTQKRLEYDQEREAMQRQLAPVQSVIDNVSQLHNLQNNPDDAETDEFGNPINMGQTPGQINQNRPSQAGFKPGVAPGFNEQQVRPDKMGQARPGGPGARNSPQPNSQGQTFNKQAAPPKGNRKLPGAKGPGDPAMRKKAKQAESGSTGRAIKVNVTASKHDSMMAMAQLRHSTVHHSADARIKVTGGIIQANLAVMSPPRTMPPGGGMDRGIRPGGGAGGNIRVNPVGPARGRMLSKKAKLPKPKKLNVKKVNAGPASLGDKDIGQGTALDYNAKFNAGHGGDCNCSKCSKQMNARDFSQSRRKSLAKSGKALPHGGFPIVNRQDLTNAKRAIGRAKNPAATKRFINKRAKALGGKPIGAGRR